MARKKKSQQIGSEEMSSVAEANAPTNGQAKKVRTAFYLAVGTLAVNDSREVVYEAKTLMQISKRIDENIAMLSRVYKAISVLRCKPIDKAPAA